ncbi:MAG TPA: translation elongation factor Ts, partial [Firmicutes bacterium]|nr:translation elongation factor Ts [Bacillota bacterium]
MVHAYIHPGSRIGVLLEVNCETDFVARTDEFKELVKDIAMQVAASSPLYVQREEVPEEVIEAERDIYRSQAAQSGKPENVVERIVEGKLDDFFSKVCLLEQTFIKDQKMTISDLLKERIAQTGENLSIRRFTLYRLGEE